MYTLLQMITEAMNDLGLLKAGGAPTTDDETMGMRRFNMMVNSWAAKRLMIYAITQENFALAVDTASYTYGTGATWNSARPQKILSPAYIRDSGNQDYPVTVIGPEQYRKIGNKTLSGRPSKLVFNPTYPNATCTVYPVPTANENIYFDTVKPFTELAANSANCSFPPEYEEPLRTNLALRLAPAYGVAPSAIIVDLARDGLDSIISYNASLQVESVSSDPFGKDYAYDIRED